MINRLHGYISLNIHRCRKFGFNGILLVGRLYFSSIKSGPRLVSGTKPPKSTEGLVGCL